MEYLPTVLFHKIHMKSKDILLFLKKSNHLKSQFIHFFIEELGRADILTLLFWSDSINMKGNQVFSHD